MPVFARIGCRLPRFAHLSLAGALAACGPAVGGTPKPCLPIDEAMFEAKVAGGAASARAELFADGTSNLVTSGVQSCTKVSKAMKVCERQADFVIRYDVPSGPALHVLVPQNTPYRFNVHARPTTCELLIQD